MGPTRTNNIRRYPTSTTQPRHDLGRTQHRQIQASQRVPRRPDLQTEKRVANRPMVKDTYVYWCISHQQYVEPRTRRDLRDQLRCKIVRLNLTLMKRVDFHILSTWFDSDHSSRNQAVKNRTGMRSRAFESAKLTGRRTDETGIAT